MDGKKGGYDSFKGYASGLSQLEGAVATNGEGKKDKIFRDGKNGRNFASSIRQKEINNKKVKQKSKTKKNKKTK